MIGKKTVSEIRAGVLKASAESGVDLVKTIAGQLQKRERRPTPNPLEIETLRLLRDGLRAKTKSARTTRKQARTR